MTKIKFKSSSSVEGSIQKYNFHQTQLIEDRVFYERIFLIQKLSSGELSFNELNTLRTQLQLENSPLTYQFRGRRTVCPAAASSGRTSD